MTITQAESGLTTEVYDALVAANEDATFELIAYQWNPNWELHHYDGASNDEAQDFDTVIHDGAPYRVVGDIVQRAYGNLFNEWEEVPDYVPPTDPKSSPPQLVSDGDLHVYAVTALGLEHCSWDGSTWTSWELLLEDETILFAAPVNINRIHLVYFDDFKDLYQLGVAEYDGIDWGTQGSEIYWPYPVTSFDAASVDDDVDALVMISSVPGTLSAKYENSEVVNYVLPAGGVIGFTYRDGSWSDHIDVDILDEVTDYRYRKHVRMTKFNDVVYVIAKSGDGTAYAPLTGHRLYTSKDGRHWSRGELLGLASPGDCGAILLQNDTLLYLTYRNTAYLAQSTLQFGVTHGDMVYYLTHQVVGGISYSRQDMAQIRFTLDNGDHWLENSIMNGNNVIMLTLEAGYWIPNEGGALVRRFIPIGIFEVDDVTLGTELANYAADVTARDRTAWLSGRTEAEQFKNWEPQIIAGDEFIDYTNSGYGGMGNTGVWSGSFKTADSKLKITTRMVNDARRAIAINTQDTMHWNGSWEAAFTLTDSALNEAAGLVFWAQDKKNMWQFTYSSQFDRLYIIQNSGGFAATQWSSGSTMGWSGTVVKRWLRVETYYATIRCYYSLDGIDWTLATVYQSQGKATGDNNYIPIGMTGYIGAGDSDEDIPSVT